MYLPLGFKWLILIRILRGFFRGTNLQLFKRFPIGIKPEVSSLQSRNPYWSLFRASTILLTSFHLYISFNRNFITTSHRVFTSPVLGLKFNWKSKFWYSAYWSVWTFQELCCTSREYLWNGMTGSDKLTCSNLSSCLSLPYFTHKPCWEWTLPSEAKDRYSSAGTIKFCSFCSLLNRILFHVNPKTILHLKK